MKTIYKTFLLPLAALLWSCNSDVIDDLSGTYDNIQRLNYTTEQTQETTKLKKGLKCLNMVFSDASNNSLSLKVISSDWILKPGSYSPVADILAAPAAGQYQATVNNNLIALGNLDVEFINDVYYISGILTGSDNNRYVLNYRGSIEFVIGVDDPEPSGYSVSVAAAPVTITDYETWQTTVIPGVSKYTLAISDPDGNETAFFEAINTENLNLSDLAGTYTIAGSPTEPWLIDNGWLVPDFGMAGGAFVVGNNGEKQYITSGQIIIESVVCSTGETLYNFSGDGLGFATMSGAAGTTSLNIKFCSSL